MESEAFVRSLALRDFRNYRTLDLPLHEGFNVIAGPNAQGKTNLLEGLYLLSTTRLLRGHKDTEAVRDGALSARVEAILAPNDTKVAVHLERGSRKRAFLNGLALPRAADLIGRMPCVCLTIEDMTLIRGEPADRRLFLDLELSALYPAYLRHLAVYRRALEQRNALLKQSQDGFVPADLFEPWEEQLAEHGDALRTIRQKYILELAPLAEAFHRQLSAGEHLVLGYETKDESVGRDGLRVALQAQRGADTRRGATSIGPHRDDFGIIIDERDARLFASQGQQRTAAISLKLASLQAQKVVIGLTPLLLLDDMLSDLDERRRAQLVELVLDHAGQAILTCTEATAAGPQILAVAKVFHVESGAIR